jgi:hypothetical protein
MSEKLYVRRCERYTIWEATEKPIEVDVDKLRKCEPPYEGNTSEELWNYLESNLYDWDTQDEFIETNKEVYGEDELLDLLLEDGEHDKKIYSDSREKSCEDWVELGHVNEEYRKTGGFESLQDNGDW